MKSETFSIGCRDCYVYFRVGHRPPGRRGFRLYTRSDKIEALEAFLSFHRWHNLVFDNTTELADWQEIGTEIATIGLR